MDCSSPGSSVHGDSPGKNTEVGCCALLQGIFPTQGSNPRLMSPALAGGLFTASATWDHQGGAPICSEFCGAEPLLLPTAEVRQWSSGQHGIWGPVYHSLCHTGADILSFPPGIPSHSFREKRPDWSNTRYQGLFRSKRVSQSRFSFWDMCSVGEKCHKESRPPGSPDGERVLEAAKQRPGPRTPPGVERPLAAPSVAHLSRSPSDAAPV